MLQELKIKVWSAAIAASANSLQPDTLGCGVLVAIAINAFLAFAQAILRSLPVSGHDRHWVEPRALRLHVRANHRALGRHA